MCIPPTRQWLLVALLCSASLLPSQAAAQRVRISNLSDVDFGLMSNLQTENRRSQSICVYSTGRTSSYSVIAWGSGSGSSFALSNGAYALPYDVEWSDSAGQAGGSVLAPNVALTGQASSAGNQFCSTGPAASATLTVVLRTTDLAQARAGAYSGALTLLIAAE